MKSHFVSPERRRRFPWIFAAALVCLLLAVFRAGYLNNFASTYTACHDCFLMPTLGHDAWLVAGILLVLALASLARWKWLRLTARLTALLLILAQALDLLLLRLFTQRLYFADLLRFSGDLSADWSVARALFFSSSGFGYLVCAAGIILLLIGLACFGQRSRKLGFFLLLGAACAAAFAATMSFFPLRYVHRQYTWNVIGVNMRQGRAEAFTPAFAKAERGRAGLLSNTCSAGDAQHRNIVIVVTESLSAYQSALLDGPHNWLPNLDALARSNHYFTHFYANGFTTDGGEIAVITGRPPLIPPGYDWYSIPAFGPGPDTLPGIAHRGGYRAQYFTATNLNFLNSGAWLRGLGFDKVEGNENPFYNNVARGQFGAAPDSALFRRYEQWLDQRTDPGPFVSVLLTISSHPPFIDPRSGKIDPPNSFGYVDQQIADFYAALKARGFFENGILLITGDHHAMTPIPAQEYRRYGERAFARIPLIVVGAVDMPRVVNASFQQSDFPASLAYIMGVNYCRTAFQGIFLAKQPMPATYVVQARGDNRNRVDVYFDDKVASYLEDGDASHWMNSTRPPDATGVAAWINSQRLKNLPDTAPGAAQPSVQ